MSSLEINKILAAVLTAGVIAMTSGFIADVLFHQEELAENVYQVAVVEDGAGAAEGEAAPAAVEPVLPLLAAADPKAGEQAARKCATCHSLEPGGPHKIGPNLFGVIGRPIASAEGFSYSAALQEKSGEAWDYEKLNAFINDPAGWAPGTKMAFAGVKQVEQRADIIAFLRGLSDSPPPLPTEEEIAATAQAQPAEGQAAQGQQQPAQEGGAEPATTEGGGGGLGPLLAEADPAQGQKVARKCAACHTFEEGAGDKIGPNLHNVIGRPIAGREGFSYSQALSGKEGEWDYAALDEFLTDPAGWAPGTKMTFPGLKKPEDRAAVIAYLREMSENPPPLPQ